MANPGLSSRYSALWSPDLKSIDSELGVCSPFFLVPTWSLRVQTWSLDLKYGVSLLQMIV